MLLATGLLALALTAPPPAQFVQRVDNPWFPLTPGATLVYRGTDEGAPTRTVTTVTRRTKLIAGVRCTVVHDNVYTRGRLSERTTDWYAQDARGNVWYFGEATAELDRKGKVKTTEGSWQAGVDGAEPGIVMSAHPRVGQTFRQEHYAGHAEDHFKVLSVTKRLLMTKEWTPLEPGVVEHKRYRYGTGLIEEVSGPNRSVLISVKR